MYKKIFIMALSVTFMTLFNFNCKKQSSSQEQVSAATVNSCVVTYVEGEAFLANSDNDLIHLAVGDKLDEDSVIKTGDDSIIEFKIGKGSIIRLKENSEIKLAKLYKDDNSQNTKLFVDVGEVFAQPERINEGSSFEIETESITAGVRGTKFVVVVTENHLSKVAVKKGLVSIKKNIVVGDNIKKIEEYSPEVAKIINESVQEELVLEPNEKLEISYEKVTNLQEEINNNINNISEELAKVKDSKGKLKEVTDKIKNEKVKEISTLVKTVAKKQDVKEHEWKEEFDATQFIEKKENKTELQKNENNVNDNSNKNITKKNSIKETKNEKVLVKETVIEKTGLNLGVSLDSKKTTTTYAHGDYVISDNINKKIFCISLIKNKVKWTYSGASSITSPATKFNQDVVLSSFSNIVVLNPNGKVKLNESINNGTTNWAKSSIINKKLYIPTSRTIYQYDGKNFNELSNFPVSTGQLYVSGSGKDLFVLDFLYKTLKVYNTSSKSITWSSDEMLNPAYMAPIKSGKYMVVADGTNTLYRYDYPSTNTKAKTLNISSGVLSKMLTTHGSVYFVSLDGYFSKVALGAFNKVDRIMKVDNNPSKNSLLVKYPVLINNNIYWASDTGKLFIYNTTSGKAKLMTIQDNPGNPLIGSPASYKDSIFVLDTKGSVYKLYKKEYYK